MGDNKGVLLLAGAIAVVALASKGGQTAPPDTGGSSAFSLRIVKVSQSWRHGLLSLFNQGMAQFGQGLTLEEGSTYKVQVTVTNTSTRVGNPIAANFTVSLQGSAGAITLLTQTLSLPMSASETRTVDSKNFTIPMLTSEVAGNMVGTLSAQGGPQIATASVPVDLKFAPSIISGTIGIGGGSTGGGGTVTTGPNLVLSSDNPGGKLTGPSTTFTWNVSGATKYWLYIGTTGAGSSNLLNQSMELSLSYTASALPTDSSPIYVRLWWQTTAGWVSKDIVYTAAG